MVYPIFSGKPLDLIVLKLFAPRVGIVSFLPKILGRNWDFPKGSVWGGGVTFQSAWGERI